MLQTKWLLFGVPMLLAFGTGMGVAYHDGVTADDVREVSKDDVGKDVAVRGKVIAVDTECDWIDDKLDKDVSCFVLRDLESERRFLAVASKEPAPPLDETAVVRGTLSFYMDFNDLASAYKMPTYGYGGATYGGGSYSMPGIDLQVGLVDAAGVTKPWFFDGAR